VLPLGVVVVVETGAAPGTAGAAGAATAGGALKRIRTSNFAIASL
jgi:hypothetical protein